MKIKILGTGASEGIPGVFCNCPICENARISSGKEIRTRSQSIINDKYLIDYPMDAYMHSLKYNINYHDIDHIIVTHPHEDHYYPNDLNYRRPPYAYNSGDHQLNIYGPGSLRELYPNIPFDDKYVKVHIWKAFNTYKVGELDVTPLKALHARKFECFVYLIKSEGKTLLYGHDSGFYPEDSMKMIQNAHLDCVIFDTTMGINDDGSNHMGVNDNIKLYNNMMQSGCVDKNTIFVMSHFSHNGELTHKHLEEIAKQNGFIAAYDGIELEF